LAAFIILSVRFRISNIWLSAQKTAI
jgi:hypothetical protein